MTTFDRLDDLVREHGTEYALRAAAQEIDRLRPQPDDPLQAVIRAQEAVEAIAGVGIHCRHHAMLAHIEQQLASLRRELEAA